MLCWATHNPLTQLQAKTVLENKQKQMSSSNSVGFQKQVRFLAGKPNCLNLIMTRPTNLNALSKLKHQLSKLQKVQQQMNFLVPNLYLHQKKDLLFELFNRRN